jgi:iron complex outermembrane receptor protein
MMNSTLRLRSLLVVGVSAFALAGLATPAFAADAAAAAATDADQGVTTLQDLVVTAEKREQNLQDVPVAISAYTSAKRDLVGINSVQDMTNFTPGLQYSTQTDRISLRGVGRLSNVHSADSSVASYSDGVYSTSTVQAGETPIFIDRLEVLRGPQGTLYGRNSIGGAINIVSKKPTKDFYAEVRGTYSNYNHTLLEGAVSGPLSDKVQFRVAANWERQTKGWFHNVNSGSPDEGNVINTVFVEAQLAVQFSDTVDTWFKVSIPSWHNGGGGPGSRSSYTPFAYNNAEVVVAGLNTNAGFGYNPLAVSRVGGCPTGNPAVTNPRNFCTDTPSTVKLTDTVIFANQWNFHGDGFDVRYITGGTHYHYTLTGDLDGTSVSSVTTSTLAANPPGFPTTVTYPTQYSSNYQEIERWWSHEINIVSTGEGPLQWLVGGYFYNESYDQPVYTQLNDPRLAGTVLSLTTFAPVQSDPLQHIYDDRPHFNVRSRAVFGQVDWKLNDQFKVTGGLRYGTDHKYGTESARVIVLDNGVFPIPGGSFPLDASPTLGAGVPVGVVGPTVIDPATGFASRSYNASWSALTGTAGVEWQPDHDTMVFAKYSRGYKAGGFRVGIDTSLGAGPLTDKETVDSFEIGVKKDFGHTLRTNIDLFHYNYNNAQVPLSQPNTGGGVGAVSNSILFNVPRAISQGIELEATWQPIDNLQILFNYSYLDAHITNGLAIDPADPAALATGARPVQTAASCSNTAYINPATGLPFTTSTCPTDVFTSPFGSTSNPPTFVRSGGGAGTCTTAGAAGGFADCITRVTAFSATPNANGGYQRFQDLNGNNLPNSAKHRFTINANYTWRMDKGNLTGSVTYVWRDAQYGSIFNRSYYRAPSYSQVDGRLTWTAANDKYTVILFAKNIFNTLGYANGATATRYAGTNYGQSAASRFNEVQGIATTYELTPPRTYGIELHYKFF